MELTMVQMVDYYMEVYGVSEKRAIEMLEEEFSGETIEEEEEDEAPIKGGFSHVG